MTVVINGGTGISTPGLSSTADVTLAGSGVELLNNSGRIVVGQSGSVIQVLQTVKTDTFSSTTYNTWTDITGLSVAITPTSTSSKILVFVNLGAVDNTPTGTTARITRAGTAICTATGAGNRATGSFSELYNPRSDSFNMVSQTFLDSPASVSSLTYAVQFICTGGTFYVNRSTADTDSTGYTRGVSSITVMEIAQ